MAFRRKDERVRLELLPLVDVVFLLLIFFIIANSIAITKSEERVVEPPVDEFVERLPGSESSKPLGKEPPQLLIQIEKDDERGEMRFYLIPPGTTPEAVKRSNPQGVSFSTVLDTLRNLGENARDSDVKPIVKIRADKDITYGTIMRIMDVCKGTDREPLFDNISFAIRREG